MKKSFFEMGLAVKKIIIGKKKKTFEKFKIEIKVMSVAIAMLQNIPKTCFVMFHS